MLEAKFRAMVDRDVLALARQVSGELSTEAEKNKLLAGRVEELECKLAKGGILEVFGCGGLIARRLAQRPR